MRGDPGVGGEGDRTEVAEELAGQGDQWRRKWTGTETTAGAQGVADIHHRQIDHFDP